jgi:hypothetical protein
LKEAVLFLSCQKAFPKGQSGGSLVFFAFFAPLRETNFAQRRKERKERKKLTPPLALDHLYSRNPP